MYRNTSVFNKSSVHKRELSEAASRELQHFEIRLQPPLQVCAIKNNPCNHCKIILLFQGFQSCESQQNGRRKPGCLLVAELVSSDNWQLTQSQRGYQLVRSCKNQHQAKPVYFQRKTRSSGLEIKDVCPKNKALVLNNTLGINY